MNRKVILYYSFLSLNFDFIYNNLDVEQCLEQISEIIQKCDFLLNNIWEDVVKKPNIIYKYDISI